MQADYEKRIREMKEKYETEITNLNKKNQEDLNNINTTHREHLKTVTDQLKDEKEKTVKQLTDKYESMLASLKEEHQTKVTRLTDEHQQRIAQKEQTIEKLNEEKRTMEEVFKEKEQAINNNKILQGFLFNMYIDQLKTTIAQRENVIAQREADIQGMVNRVKNAEQMAEDAVKEHQRRTAEIDQQYRDKERLLQETLRKQMQRMIEEQCREIEEMQVEFNNAGTLLQEKYGQLDMKFHELQELYEARPSRPEDLTMIQDQSEQITRKDDFIKKQEDDMKFYKLELINREQSYNQMFGTAPQIAGLGGMVQGKPNLMN